MVQKKIDSFSERRLSISKKMLLKTKPLERELVEAVLEGDFSLSRNLRCAYWLAQSLPLSELEIFYLHPSITPELMKYFSFNPNLTLEFVLSHLNWEWDLRALSANQAFGWRDVLEHRELPWEGKGLSYNPRITLRDVLSPESRELNIQWDLQLLARNPSITFEDVWKHRDLPWKMEDLIRNPNFKIEHLIRLWGFKNPYQMKHLTVRRLHSLPNWKCCVNPPPLDWFHSESTWLSHPDFPKGMAGLKELGVFLGNFLDDFLEDFSRLLRKIELDQELLEFLLNRPDRIGCRAGLEISLLGNITKNKKLWLREVLRFSFKTLNKEKTEELFFKKSSLLATMRFTEEELLENFKPWWDLNFLMSNPCFTFNSFKSLVQRFPREWHRAAIAFRGNYLSTRVPLKKVAPFNFPELPGEQWRLYPSLTRGARLELVITYWILGPALRARKRESLEATRKKGKRLSRKARARRIALSNFPELPLELIALTASFVIGRVYPVHSSFQYS